MKSIMENYHVNISVLDDIIEEYRGNTEATSTAIGVQARGVPTQGVLAQGVPA